MTGRRKRMTDTEAKADLEKDSKMAKKMLTNLGPIRNFGDAPTHTDEGVAIRTFATGATRSPLGNKLEYKGYLNPLVLKRYAEYMKKHQTQSDSTQRAADNWQRGIDIASLYDSKLRHDMDIWLYSEGYKEEMTEDIEESLCASIFNSMAILKQVLEAKGRSK